LGETGEGLVCSTTKIIYADSVCVNVGFGENSIALLDSRTKPCYSVRQGATMQETKLTVRLPRELLENAKRYARKQNTTVTNLISEYLRRMPASLDILEDAPIVRRLSGTLSKNVSVADYKKHVETKYGSKN